MKFTKLKEFTYQRKANHQTNQIQIPSPQILNQQADIQVQIQENNNNNSSNQARPPAPAPPPPIHTKNSDSSNTIKQSSRQSYQIIQQYDVKPQIPKKIPYLFLPYLVSFILNLGFGISIFATQGSEAAIIVFEVFLMLLNIFSGIYYYRQSTEKIFKGAKSFKILFGTILAQLLCSFIQLLICWITKVSFSLEIVNAIQLIIFLLYFYYMRRRYLKS